MTDQIRTTTDPAPAVVRTDGGDPDSLGARAKDEVERAKEVLDEVKTDVAAAVDAKRGGKATSVDDAASKAAQLRAEIEQDVATLRTRIPDVDDLRARGTKAAVAVGGGAVALGTLVLALRKRAARRSEKRETQEQAAALARALAREMARLDAGETDEASEAKGGARRWLLLLAAVAGAGTVWWRGRTDARRLDEPFGDAFDGGLEGPHGIGAI